ncbi:MAG: F0F1 ATP synthase subunit delta [Lactobacillales bacterium]|jgi:F-type H+-transporting ATPase subunit delta|nr:F0F1 ATP synthase subunit delta [Lactobacillales bacterium]
MASKFEVAKKYARSLFDVALEQNALDSVTQDLLALQQIAESAPEAIGYISESSVAFEIRNELFGTLIQNFSGITANFLKLVNDNNRFEFIDLIVKEFINISNKHNGVASGVLITAIEPNPGQVEKIEAAASKLLNAKKVELKSVVDPSIIGGVIVRSDDNVIDGSIRTQLQNIKKTILTK